MDQTVTKLRAFLDSVHSTYHCIAALAEEMDRAGYECLQEHRAWELKAGGKYYFTRGGTALMAFRLPEGTPAGFRMSASHADVPTFKLKENPELTGTYTRLAVERYGGMLISTWLDRPLSLAGRVLVETPEGVESRLVDLDRDLLLIPNVAIHMNRKANEGYAWNPAVDTLPLMGNAGEKGRLNALLEEAADGKILGHDLYLYLRQKSTVWGMEEEFLSSAGLDDRECVWCCTRGFLDAGESNAVPVLCVFDSEEVGSASVQGAASDLLENLLGRICSAMGYDLLQMLSQSFMVSADNGHAIHPNHPEYADPTNAPVMNQGLVLKYNAAQRYITDGLSGAVMRKICQLAEVPVQTYFNRADLPGGSTLGNISLGHVSVPTVDLGLPQLAMHSAYETAGVRDVCALADAMTAYYSVAMEVTGDGCFSIRK